MATISDSGLRTAAPAPGGEAAALRKSDRRRLVVCQILGLAALALIAYASVSGEYRFLRHAAVIALALLIIPRSDLAPYIYILNFFTLYTIYRNGRMLAVLGSDVIFLVLILAFIASNRFNIRAALCEQGRLLFILTAFMLWAILSYALNFYSHSMLVNITSAFFIFNFVQIIAIVVLFSQPQWKPYREKAIFFYVILVVLEIAVTLASEVLGGAKSLSDFSKMTGTLGDHHGLLANVMILSFGVAMGAYFMLKGRFKKLLSACAGIASIALLFLSGSRGSLLGLMVAMPVTAFLGYRLRKSTLILVFAASVAAGIIFWISPMRTLLFNMMNMQSAESVDMSAYGRIIIWERVYDHAVNGPWMQKIFGIGMGTFNTLPFDHFVEVGTFTTGAHNNFMHAFVELGIVGLILFLAIFGEIIRRLVIWSRRGDNTARCFLISTLALLLSGMTQETFWFNTSFGRFWVMYVLFYVMLFNFRDNEPEPACTK
ncbi:MAG: O-antigen ligase family protein [Chitinispirillia bacterium]|nr:O-antigen ligase family protein [Chitinispirillia bacterium]MCL2267758.1 O-antigen ligase family protein [Chitinispirillia bacterium]